MRDGPAADGEAGDPTNGAATPPEGGGTGPVDLRNSSMMAEKPGLLLRLLGALFFRKVLFADEQVEKLKDLEREGVVVYVMASQSLLDYLYFNWAFLRKRLPRAVFGHGMRMWPFRTLGAIIRGLARRLLRRWRFPNPDTLLRNAPKQGRSVVLFLRKARTILPWFGEFHSDPLRPMVEAQREMDRPIVLVPILLVWERAPGRFRRSIIDMVFGDPDAPGRFRKLANFVGNHRHALVQVGEALRMDEFLAEHAHLERPEAVVQKIRWALNHRFHLERKVIKGPTLKNAAQIREELLRLDPFKKRLVELAEAQGRTLEEVQGEAEAYLKEMVADWKLSYIEFMLVLLTFVFGRLYAGIEPRGLTDVREAAKRAPLIVLPSHKSHIDYLLISFIFYGNGLVPPHIAAGDNLNFWPLGHLFRRSGAFFLRRNFKQNDVYTATFRTYVQKLLKAGYSIEFFIEGGRSRTGKVLRPRYGLLGDVVDAVVEGHIHDLSMCPAAIGYEKIVESEGYRRELSGESKERENLGQLVSATRVLRERFGRVYLSFPVPFSLREFLEADGVDFDTGWRDAAERKRVVQQLSYRVLGDINSASVTTASALVAFALLTNPDRGVSRDTLLRRVGALVDYVLHCGGHIAAGVTTPLAANRVALERTRGAMVPPSSRPTALVALDGASELAYEVGQTLADVVDETTALFVGNKLLSRHSYDTGDIVYQVPPDARIELDYYKNNLVHLFVRESILAAALLRCWREDDLFGDRLRKECEFLSRLLKHEYIYDQGRPFDAQYRETLELFQDAGVLEADRAARIILTPASMRTLRLLATLTLPVLEGYYVTAQGIDALPEAMEESDLMVQLQRTADRLWRQGQLSMKEAISSVTFKNALGRFMEDGLVAREHRDKGRKKARFAGRGPALEDDPQALGALAARLKRFLIPSD